MAEHVLRLGGNEFFGLHHVALGGVPALNLLHLFLCVIGEHVLEDLVHIPAGAHRALDRAACVQDRDDGLIPLCVGKPVHVDVLAEDRRGPLLLAHQDGGAGEADAGAVRQRVHEVLVQLGGMRTVGLVNQQDDGLISVQQGEPGSRLAFDDVRVVQVLLEFGVVLLFLDHHADDAGAVLSEQPPSLSHLLGGVDLLAS